MVARFRSRTTIVLPLVKAYPSLSRKYGEVACVAGIDLEHKELVRLYPVPFRDFGRASEVSEVSANQSFA